MGEGETCAFVIEYSGYGIKSYRPQQSTLKVMDSCA